MIEKCEYKMEVSLEEEMNNLQEKEMEEDIFQELSELVVLLNRKKAKDKAASNIYIDLMRKKIEKLSQLYQKLQIQKNEREQTIKVA